MILSLTPLSPVLQQCRPHCFGFCELHPSAPVPAGHHATPLSDFFPCHHSGGVAFALFFLHPDFWTSASYPGLWNGGGGAGVVFLVTRPLGFWTGVASSQHHRVLYDDGGGGDVAGDVGASCGQICALSRPCLLQLARLGQHQMLLQCHVAP